MIKDRGWSSCGRPPASPRSTPSTPRRSRYTPYSSHSPYGPYGYVLLNPFHLFFSMMRRRGACPHLEGCPHLETPSISSLHSSQVANQPSTLHIVFRLIDLLKAHRPPALRLIDPQHILAPLPPLLTGREATLNKPYAQTPGPKNKQGRCCTRGGS